MNNPPRRRVFVETAKNSVLAAAVISSVALSALIWTGTPSDLTLDRVSYFSAPPAGIQKTVQELLQPKSMLFCRQGDCARTGMGDSLYKKIWSALKSAELSSWKFIPSEKGAAKDGDLPSRTGTLRLQYEMTVPGDLAPSAVPVRGMPQKAILGPVVFFSGPGGNLSLRFASAGGWIEGAISRFPEFPGLTGEFSSGALSFVPLSGPVRSVWVPARALSVPFWRVYLTTPPVRSVVDSYFSDPASVMEVKDRGRVLYTDGMRAVWIYRADGYEKIEYQNPQPSAVGRPVTARQSLFAAVRFINEHGGFSGGQTMVSISQGGVGSYDFSFGGVAGGWPIFGGVDQVSVRVSGGEVTSADRTLRLLITNVAGNSVQVPSARSILGRLPPAVLRGVTRATLGYRVRNLTGATAELVPTYRVVSGGRVLYLDARTGAATGNAEG